MSGLVSDSRGFKEALGDSHGFVLGSQRELGRNCTAALFQQIELESHVLPLTW